MKSVGGSLVARINGKEINSTTQHGTNADDFPLVGNVHVGQNIVEILFENHGSANGGADMELEQGISQVSLIPSAQLQPAVTDWKMKLVARVTQTLPTASNSKRPSTIETGKKCQSTAPAP